MDIGSRKALARGSSNDADLRATRNLLEQAFYNSVRSQLLQVCFNSVRSFNIFIVGANSCGRYVQSQGNLEAFLYKAPVKTACPTEKTEHFWQIFTLLCAI